MKIKTSELTGLQLSAAVLMAEGTSVGVFDGKMYWLSLPGGGDYVSNTDYSTDWKLAGPLIEREGINLSVDYQDDALTLDMVAIGWKANLWNNSVPGTAGFLQWATGPTPLIAAMRCFVASKLGDEVDIPEELT